MIDFLALSLRWLFVVFVVLCTFGGCVGLLVVVMRGLAALLVSVLNFASLLEAAREAKAQGRAIWLRRAFSVRDWLTK